ncbi:MAG: DNA-directed RNA polymerase subunit K [Candidatus Micrarchaeota archaeon]
MAKKDDYSTYNKYEKARVIGARALQLAMGAPPLVKVEKGLLNSVRLAETEYAKGIIPLQVMHT